MTSINISLKKEAYDFLKSLKTEDKSFSDVILSFKKEDNLTSFYGVLKDKDWDKNKKIRDEIRSSFNKRLK